MSNFELANEASSFMPQTFSEPANGTPAQYSNRPTLISYTGFFRNSTRQLYADSHNSLIPVEFHNKWLQHRRNVRTEKVRL